LLVHRAPQLPLLAHACFFKLPALAFCPGGHRRVLMAMSAGRRAGRSAVGRLALTSAVRSRRTWSTKKMIPAQPIVIARPPEVE
jgi:hypothetical protein